MKKTNYCWNIEKIENYDLAKADNFKGWVIHHKLELYDSDNNKRKVELTADELIALDMYFYRPENELIFLTMGQHRALHNTIDKKGKPSHNKGKKMTYEQKRKISKAHKGKKHSEESRKRISEGMKGLHWYTNGIINKRTSECPESFKPGRIYKRKELKK